MTFTRLRIQVDSLMRKYYTELQLYRAAPLALELCDQMADAVTPGRPNSKLTCDGWAFNLFRKLRDQGIRVRGHVRLSDYLNGCLRKLLLPQVSDVLRSLFPKAADRGLIPRSRMEVPFWPRRVWKPGMGYFAQTLADAAGASRARLGYR
ncbi:MAG: hypothetical protein F4X27_14320 [Chloroflexi bacterium]|nr:hypothetical protein [Chloroflexota bacterium]